MADFALPESGYVVVYDLEYTAWPGSLATGWSRPGEYMEVVQLGAVRLDAGAGLEECGSLRLLVRPRINPDLSDYFTNLTGITQVELDRDGVSFPEMLDAFTSFCDGAGPILANGTDEDVLIENCALNHLPPPGLAFIDISPWLGAALGVQGHVVSGTLTGRLDLPAVGRAHDGLADARAIAAALRFLNGFP